ncbi:ribosomal protein S6 kinase delta-1 isoform X2 [Phlebotomus papatasi]|uniref:ribosomal protein S6 kinase delta-1 isoform X2 n=1 Tax=Phlebotomus papatasi TaxID=29031 RepID=UPI0024843F63|nr:ribosomal protein S6 kinase delta-1 isoform X2 [Phlebotomus papatasi]
MTMATAEEGWVHSFSINDIARHKKGYTIYKITSIVFPRFVPEALSCVTVWKRFSEIKNLHREIHRKHRALKLGGKVPKLEDRYYFRRFDTEVINERRQYILELLEFVSMHPALYTSEVFVKFLRGGHTPNTSPSHKGNIAAICKDLSIPFQSEIALIDPTRDSAEVDSDILPFDCVDSVSTVSVDTLGNGGSDLSRRDSVVSDEGSVGSVTREPSVASSRQLSLHLDISQDIDYFFDAAVDFSRAMQAEVNGQYEESFECYKKGINTLLVGAKQDRDVERQQMAKEKASKYLKRAERVCENHIVRKPKNFSPSDTEPYSLERPLSNLSRYKVMKIVERVMQVQDVTDKKIYIMKAIEKPPSSSLFLGAFLPHKIPYMVPLIAYFQSESSIYLLLHQAPGGKLYDYIRDFKPGKFSAEKIPPALLDKPEVQQEPEPEKPKDSLEEKPVENEEISPEENHQPPPSFDILSKDMDVLDLVHCAKSLLKSVSSTLKQSKGIGKALEEITLPPVLQDIPEENEPTEEIPVQNDNNSLPEEAQDAVLETPAETTPKKHQIPEGCVRQWARELVVAVDTLHRHNVLCCDLHPNNLLLGSSGQLLLTYFYCHPDATERFLKQEAVAGGYVAPERPFTEVSDWWTVGVILYEILTQHAFTLLHPGEIFTYYEVQYPEEVEISDEARALLDGLLQVNPSVRFGIDEIQTHAFFRDTDWENIKSLGHRS